MPKKIDTLPPYPSAASMVRALTARRWSALDIYRAVQARFPDEIDYLGVVRIKREYLGRSDLDTIDRNDMSYEDEMRTGSEKLLKALWAEHPQLMVAMGAKHV